MVAKRYNQARQQTIHDEQNDRSKMDSKLENNGDIKEDYISQARRRAIQVLMHQTVEARETKKYRGSNPQVTRKMTKDVNSNGNI